MKAAVEQVQQQYAFSQRRACGLLMVAVSSCRYQPRHSDEELRVRLVELAREKPRFGYRRLQVLLRRSGEVVNHKRVHRVYREAGLALRRKKAQTLCPAERTASSVHRRQPGVGSGFCARCDRGRSSDPGAECGRCLYARVPALEVDTSFASRRVTRVLDEIIEQRGEPRSIRCDNGPELTSRHFLAWCIERRIELVHIQPGKPTQNAHVESFHGRLREECLRVSWFQNLFDAQAEDCFLAPRLQRTTAT